MKYLCFLQLHIPPYASALFFELYERDTGYYVKLFYRKTNVEKPSPLLIPGCGKLCPLQRWYEIYKNILPSDTEDHDTLCKL